MNLYGAASKFAMHGWLTFSGMINAKPLFKRHPSPDLKALFKRYPSPIVDSRNKLVLLWSAKAGCTFAIKWLFHHMDLLKESKLRVHEYRIKKLCPSDEYKAEIEDFFQSPSAYRMVKFVRDPFKRAVSSYVQAARFGHQDAGISACLGRSLAGSGKFSFREFVRYLQTIDVSRCDIHHQKQAHPLERHLIPATMFLINLNDSMQSLPKLESFLGLQQTDPCQYRDSHHHTRTSMDIATEFSGDTVFNIYGEPTPAVPAYRTFYDKDLESAIVGLYAEDFLRYGFSTNLDVP